MFDLTNKTVVISGGTSGIGLECARLFVEQGSNVCVFSHDHQQVDEAVENTNFPLMVRCCDATDAAQLQALVDEVVTVFGSVDVLVNAAGLQIFGNAEEVSIEEWNRSFSVNCTSILLATRLVVPLMREAGGGSIINFSSIIAHLTAANRLGYTAAKISVIGITKAMAVDYAADNIRVNAISPGAVDTEMLRNQWRTTTPDIPEETLLQKTAQAHPLQRIARPEEIANVVVFLGSKASSFMTGTVLNVDGGLSAQLGSPKLADN